MKNLILALSFVFTLFVGHAQVHAQVLPIEPLDRIVAVIDEDVILQSELNRAVQNVLTQYAKNPQQLPPRNILERQVLERLILVKLQVLRAESTGIRVSDAEIDQSIEQIAQQNRMDLAQLRGSLQQQGISYDDFRKNIREELLVQRIHQRVVQGRVQVGDSEIDLLLAGNSLKAGETHLAQILIAVPDGASPEQIEAAHAKANDVKKQVDNGMDFSAAAIRYSDAQNALDGGDLGWRRFEELPGGFAEMTQSMSEGEVSQPVRGPSGFHIIKLVGKRDQGKSIVTEYHARHLVIKTSELVSSDEALKKIRDLRQRIVSGEADFAKEAKQRSQDPNTANLGGDMGWFAIAAYGTKVEQALQALKKDEVSEPFQTELGWHIMQLLGTREEDKTTDLQRQQARQILQNRKAEDEYENFVRQLRADAYIDVRLAGAATDGTGP